jgi:hypothetical protein
MLGLGAACRLRRFADTNPGQLQQCSERRHRLRMQERTPAERVIYDAEHPTHIRPPWQAIVLAALRQTIAAPAGSRWRP